MTCDNSAGSMRVAGLVSPYFYIWTIIDVKFISGW
jgi:hypothetical protein